MKRRRVRFTAAAHRHFNRQRAWWIKNRDQRELFAIELERALEILATQPYIGSKQYSRRFVGLRKHLLRKSRYHIYYTVDAEQLVVRALWGAQRARGPRI